MNAIQKKSFSGGGFVLHRIQGGFSGKASAWFDENAKLVDAEQIDRLGRSRPVNLKGNIGCILQQWGRVYKNRPDFE